MTIFVDKQEIIKENDKNKLDPTDILSEKFHFLELTDREREDTSLYSYYLIFDSIFEILDEFKDITWKKSLTQKELISESIRNKKLDIYHSTTIEWYKISQDDIDTFLWYNLKKENTEQNLKDLENIVVVQGYSKAFDYVLNNPTSYLNDEYIKDINQRLWSVSYEMNWIDEIDQRRYRMDHKQMRNSTWYSMPQPYDIYQLMEIYCRNINKIENPYLRAIVAHFLLVPIQPFNDWNGRTSRFIMNTIFISNWFPWKTVTDHHYRIKYLSSWWLGGDNTSLRRYKLQETFRSFVEYIMTL